jgi:hypothetical protein
MGAGFVARVSYVPKVGANGAHAVHLSLEKSF